jgi:TPR repeat protein
MPILEDEASDLYQAGKYEAAFHKYQALAEQGNTRAQLILAGMLAEGIGTPLDKVKSKGWYRRAAHNGSAEAQHHLGYLCFQNKDYLGATNWYRKAAAFGYLPALWRLAWLYKKGKGVPLDPAKAYELFEEAAQRGHVFAKRDLAVMLVSGHKGFRHVLGGIALLFRYTVDGIKAASQLGSHENTKI